MSSHLISPYIPGGRVRGAVRLRTTERENGFRARLMGAPVSGIAGEPVRLEHMEVEMGWDRGRLLVALVAAALVVASCGGGGGESTPTTADACGADSAPFEIEGDRITGSRAGLEQIWPDVGAATVHVTWDFEIPSEVLEDC